ALPIYQRTGPQVSDLGAGGSIRNDGISKAAFAGAAAMTILVATALMLAVSQTGSASNQLASAETAEMPPGHVVPSEAELVLMNQMTLHNVDVDNSGYIDGAESPANPSQGEP